MKNNTLKLIALLFVLAVYCFAPACKQTAEKPNAKADTTAVANTTDTASATTNLAAAPNAAGHKLGYVNSLLLLNDMPQRKEADKKLESLAKGKENKFKNLMTDYEKKMRDLQEKAASLTPIEQEARAKDLTDLEEKLQKMQMSGQDELQAEKDKLYAPILALADSVIKQIGKEGGYTFIFDAPSLLYADSLHTDLTPLVKQRLGIK